jgi:hypothetical protein
MKTEPKVLISPGKRPSNRLSEFTCLGSRLRFPLLSVYRARHDAPRLAAAAESKSFKRAPPLQGQQIRSAPQTRELGACKRAELTSIAQFRSLAVG